MKEIKRLKNVVILAGAFLSAATLRGDEYAESLTFRIGEFDEQGYPQTPSLEKWNGCLTYFFIEGQNNVESVKTIQGLLNEGDTSFADKAFCYSTVKKTTVHEDYPEYDYFSAEVIGNTTTKLALGEYTAFAVLFDAQSVNDITVESTKYLVLNNFQQVQEVYTLNDKTTHYKYTFNDTSAGTLAAKEDYWGTFGIVPEPTSGVMLLLGVAALALKRKRG